MMDQVLQQQDAVKNQTAALEALSPWLNNPRQTIARVEVLTAVVILLLLLQLVLGSLRRQSTRFVVQSGTWVAYTVSFPLIAYTLGMMQSSPVKNVLYPIWAACLLLAACCTNALKAYDLDDSKKWKRRAFNLLQYSIYTSMICWLLVPYKPTLKDYLFFGPIGKPFALSTNSSLRYLLYLCTVMAIVSTHWMALKRHFERDQVDSFVKDLESSTNEQGYHPATMEGYKYPLRVLESSEDGYYAITIDQIWECQGIPVNSEMKDVCLAFALYERLKRRYNRTCRMPSTEEDLRKSHEFVLEGLLGTEDGFDRAFRIVEVELGFWHDHLFTKYGSIFKSHISRFFMFVVRVFLLIRIGVYVLQNTLSIKTFNAIIEVRTEKADNCITLLILGTILMIELLQVVLYLASDWFKVHVACQYVQCQCFPPIWKLAGYISSFTIFRHYWKHRIGQGSVVSHRIAGITGGSHANMLRTMKQAIARSVKSCQGRLTNGEGSLMRNHVLENFIWALRGQSQAEIMLTWSIATDYCKIAPTNADPMNEIGTSTIQQEKKHHEQIAVNISRYCVHLMYSKPELLPGYFADTTFTIRDVTSQSGNVGRYLDDQKNYQAMNNLEDLEEDQTIFMRGVKLGKQLERMSDSVLRWKVMADFWAEKILYIAPSDNVKEHMERLAKGGEFLTHIWALLTHAGIIKINRDILFPSLNVGQFNRDIAPTNADPMDEIGTFTARSCIRLSSSRSI